MRASDRLAAAMVLQHGRGDACELEAVIRDRADDWISLINRVKRELALTEDDDPGIAEEQAAYLVGVAVGLRLGHQSFTAGGTR